MTIKRIKNNIRKVTLSFAAFVVALSGVVAVGAINSSSAAAGTMVTCYSKGYGTPVASYPIYQRSTVSNAIIARTGTLEVYYKSSTGKNCAMAKCYGSGCGPSMGRTVAIKPSGDANWDDVDQGMFAIYAGPVETDYSTRGRCVDVYARFGTSTAATDDTYGSIYKSKILCG